MKSAIFSKLSCFVYFSGDSLSYNSGAQFETIGRYGCASLFHGGWWYKGCTQVRHCVSIYYACGYCFTKFYFLLCVGPPEFYI